MVKITTILIKTKRLKNILHGITINSVNVNINEN